VAKKFLIFMAVVILIVIAGGIALSLWGPQLMSAAMVPSAEFKPLPAPPANAWAAKDHWIARPDIAENPSIWLPQGSEMPPTKGNAAVFFIHPTSFFDRKQWNASLGSEEADRYASVFVRGQASAFSAAGDVWGPHYRQATFGAFLTDKPEGVQAIDAAYADVLAAFDQFLKEAGNRPIILAGHSQGALHLTRLLKERVAGTPLAKRIIAAYVVGWPISIKHDLPSLGLPACTAPDQQGCILSWQSYAEPADPSQVIKKFESTTGFDGRPRTGSTLLCTNPVTGTRDGQSPATANLGTLKSSADLTTGELIKATVAARCVTPGFLMIGEGPDLGRFVLPGNNYHVYDYSLFWANIRADALRRLAAAGSK
jgi:Protein of unknown function (DUF3089)